MASLYDQYAPRVLGLLVRMLPSRSDADDVLQEVFWQVWKRADKYDAQRGSAVTWLLVIARYQAIDWLRRHKPTVNSEATAEPSASYVPVDNVEQEESAANVQKLLKKIPVEQRNAICLSFYDGLAHKDIASRMDVPLGTVKTRIRLGMKRLRELAVADDAAWSDHGVERATP